MSKKLKDLNIDETGWHVITEIGKEVIQYKVFEIKVISNSIDGLIEVVEKINYKPSYLIEHYYLPEKTVIYNNRLEALKEVKRRLLYYYNENILVKTINNIKKEIKNEKQNN